MRTAADAVVALSGVAKRFGSNPALTSLDLQVLKGQITVLLGPNGAGKTTAIPMTTGAFTPDSGEVPVFGPDPSVDGGDVRPRCGVVSAKPSPYDPLSRLTNLRYAPDPHPLARGANLQPPH